MTERFNTILWGTDYGVVDTETDERLFNTTLTDKLNEQDAKIKELEHQINVLQHLTQQYRNELNQDCYKEARKYQREFMRVCEELAELQMERNDD